MKQNSTPKYVVRHNANKRVKRKENQHGLQKVLSNCIKDGDIDHNESHISSLPFSTLST